TDEDQTYRLKWALRDLESERNPVALDEQIMKEYVGTYGSRKIVIEDGILYYIHDKEGHPLYELTALGNDWFKCDILSYFRIQFVRNDSGKITELIGWYENGRTSSHILTVD
ncbi:MAG: hypothetical protein JSU69_11825, partial [Candidatus Zixiibacteriota bacterium]